MSRESDPVPNFTLGELTAFLEHGPAEPIETDFLSSREWARRYSCSIKKIRALLHLAMEQGSLETVKGYREGIDGRSRPVTLYKFNLK